MYLPGCKGKNGPATDAENSPAAGRHVDYLPLPKVPPDLFRPEERSAYVALHFWDALDFARDTLALDSAFMEQSFANFLDRLNATSPGYAQISVDTLMTRALQRPEVFDLVWWMTTHYLDDPNSPMRDEELMIHFLRHASGAENGVPEATRERARHRLAQAMKNRRGTKSADFRFVTRDGTQTTLHSALKGAGETILMFYDPDCEVCADVEKQMASDAGINNRIKSGELQIIAIDPFGTESGEWRRHADTLPAGWTVGLSPGGEIDDREIYDIRATPTIYILGRDGEVIAKDVML